MHTIILTSMDGQRRRSFDHAGSLATAKNLTEAIAAGADVGLAVIKTNRGTTWRLRNGRWIHDTGRTS